MHSNDAHATFTGIETCVATDGSQKGVCRLRKLHLVVILSRPAVRSGPRAFPAMHRSSTTELIMTAILALFLPTNGELYEIRVVEP